MKQKLLFVGPVLTASGYGVHARQLLRFIVESDKYDIYVRSLRWGETSFLYGEEGNKWIVDLVDKFNNTKNTQFDISVQVTIPNEFQRCAHFNIGVTAGIEVDRVSPAWLQKANSEIDLLVVPSLHSQQAFSVVYQGNEGNLQLQRPVVVVPEAVDISVFNNAAPCNSAILNEAGVTGKNFIFVGLGMDKANGSDRKNVTKLVEWFCRTFDGQDVGLVLKTGLVNGSLIDFELTSKRIKEIKGSTTKNALPRIHLVHGRLTEQQFAEMYHDERIISMISLTHGEGYGLPLIEAAACDLPIIATDWSGHLDFLTKDGRKLFVPIDFDLATIPNECVWDGVMDQGTRWAVPKEADASAKMKKVVLQPPKEWAVELGEHVRSVFNYKRVGDFFRTVVDSACSQFTLAKPSSKESLAKTIKDRLSIQSSKKTLLYTMPMSAGDVFLSTGVVAALRKKFPEHRLFFATQPKYFDLLRDNQDIDDVIEWMSWMTDVAVLEDIFDEIYTPNLNIQMVYSNWMHRGKGRNLLEEMAVHCDVESLAPTLPSGLSEYCGQIVEAVSSGATWVAVHAGAGMGQWSARSYSHWEELVTNARAAGLRVVQVGSEEDVSVGEVDLDLRGKTSYSDIASVLANCKSIVCIDSFPMHVAAHVGIGVVALFGGSYPTKTGPCMVKDRKKLKLIETPDRKGCDRACYKNECKVEKSNPCVNEITPQSVFSALGEVLGRDLGEYKEKVFKLAGYTHVLNPKSQDYPYVDSISSMLGFCDEVVVVDGGSTDNSVEVIKELFADSLATGKLRIELREWDWSEPGMDGMQKAFGRAMCSPDADFLWQQDADEVVRPNDYAKIRALLKNFPRDQKLMHLPVIELWGDDKTVRTDRHAWKWRLSRNDFRITHGINMNARLMDPDTGKYYAKKGQSDGCEFIDIVSGEFIPHFGFWDAALENIRQSDAVQYGKHMNDIFDLLPSVVHYSWKDLPRKIRNFRDFWDKCWANLYLDKAPTPRFPDVVTDEDVLKKAEELRARGGEHGAAKTFELKI